MALHRRSFLKGLATLSAAFLSPQLAGCNDDGGSSSGAGSASAGGESAHRRCWRKPDGRNAAVV